VPILTAGAPRSETLVQAGVERADALIPCTDDELANLDIALDARELNPDVKVVIRLFDVERLETALDLSVVCHQRQGGSDLHPSPDLVLTAGDRVLVLARLERLEQVH
jgi:Trk K+ transport system NAD-binding subunit